MCPQRFVWRLPVGVQPGAVTLVAGAVGVNAGAATLGIRTAIIRIRACR